MRNRFVIRWVMAAVAMAPVLAGTLAAQSSVVGTLLVAHGGDVAWNARIHGIAHDIDTGGPVATSFLMGPEAADHRFQDEVRVLVSQGARRIVVVPVLASSHSGHYEQIRYLVGVTDELSESMMHHLQRSGIARPRGDVPLTLVPAIDASMELADVLVERGLALADATEQQAMFLVGHGPTTAENYANWMEALRPIAQEVQSRAGFKDVKLGLLRDDAPELVRMEAVRRIREIIELQHDLTGLPVVVVPILISKGYISTRKLPKDLKDLAVSYNGEGLLPHPAMTRWVERRVREASALVRVEGSR